jgi:hypothetical protein
MRGSSVILNTKSRRLSKNRRKTQRLTTVLSRKLRSYLSKWSSNFQETMITKLNKILSCRLRSLNWARQSKSQSENQSTHFANQGMDSSWISSMSWWIVWMVIESIKCRFDWLSFWRRRIGPCRQAFGRIRNGQKKSSTKITWAEFTKQVRISRLIFSF